MAKEIEQTKDELVALVRAHALAHYDEDGWDILVECWEDEQIKQALGRSKKASGAIWAVKQRLAPLVEFRAAAEAA